MRNIINIVRKAPKRLYMAVAVAAAVVTVPAALLAWGPDRPTFTTQKPANYVTFNSITDNPVYGDERNFVNVKDAANTQNGGWQDTVNVQPGKKYLVRMYVHNNAAANLNLKSVNTRVKASVPTTTGNSVSISGFVSSDNAKPGEIWDDIHFKSGEKFNLAYVPGSARIYNNGYAKGGNGQALPDSIVTSAGAKIGYNGPDGIVPGCFQYDNYVYFEVKPQFAPENDFTVEKQVRKNGEKDWKESVAVKPGDKVDYQIQYKNTGETRQNNVHVRDYLPKNVSYVAGTTKIANPTNPSGVKTDDGLTSGNGLNIGDYQAGSNAYLMFTAKVGDKDDLECGMNTLKNIARATADGGYKEDDAIVTVDGDECKPPVVEYRCDALTVNQLSRTSFKFSTAYTVKNATFKSVTYVVRDARGNEVYRGSDATYTQAKAGTYTVQAYVNVEVDGVMKTVTSENCKKLFKVVPKTENCPIPGKEHLPADSKDCKEKLIKVCEIETGRIVTIKESDLTGDYTTNPEDCAVPTELPETGLADAIAKISGLVSLTAATAYYVASRRI